MEPLEELDLPEGKEVFVRVIAVPARRSGEGLRLAFGSRKGTMDAEKLIRDIYEDRVISTRRHPKP